MVSRHREIRPPSDPEVRFFQLLIEEEAGIHLPDSKRPLLVGRLTPRIRALGLESFDAYARVVREDPSERVRMLDCVCTHETQFFREAWQFELLAREATDVWALQRAGDAPARVRVWSAACSTGEEAYSIAMTLAAALPTYFEIDVVGTDLSSRAIERAREAIYSLDRASQIPPHLLRRFMLCGTGARSASMRVAPELRRLVEVRRANLCAYHLPVSGPFDAIFCRNVLIYFQEAKRRAVAERLVDRLAPRGLLLMGHAETFSVTSARMKLLRTGVHVRIDG